MNRSVRTIIHWKRQVLILKTLILVRPIISWMGNSTIHVPGLLLRPNSLHLKQDKVLYGYRELKCRTAYSLRKLKLVVTWSGQNLLVKVVNKLKLCTPKFPIREESAYRKTSSLVNSGKILTCWKAWSKIYSWKIKN